MNLTDKLKLVGLNTSEVEVYLFALKNQAVKPTDVSRGTGISRTNCYNVLHQLVEKGLVRGESAEGSTVYRVNSPHELTTMLERQKMVVDEAMPELQFLNGTAIISTVEEIELIKSSLAEIQASTEIQIYGSILGADQVNQPLLNNFMASAKMAVNFQHLLSERYLGSIYIQWGNRLSILNLNGRLILLAIREENFRLSMLNWLKMFSRETF